MPAVSVLLPVHNGARYLRAALDSVLAQTFADFEVLAIDDGSTDPSRALLEDYARRDSRVRVISRANTGIVGALNDAIAAAQAPLLARMDADDIAFPDRFARQVVFLEKNPDVVLLGAAVIVIDRDGRRVKRVPRATEHGEIDRALLRGDGGALIHPAVMMRAEACHRAGRYRLATQFTEDLDLFLRLAELGKIANLAAPLLYYRMHPASVNFTRLAQKRATKEWILQDAYRRRGLAWDAAALEKIDESWRDYARLHRDWAVASLEFGGVATPLKHALLTCRHRPLARQSWSTLSYVVRAVTRHEIGPALRRRFEPLTRAWSRRQSDRFWRNLRVTVTGPVSIEGGHPTVRNDGTCRLGAGVRIVGRQFPVRLTVFRGGRLQIGDGTYINQGTNIAASHDIEIGADCQIGEWVSIYDTDFHPVHEDSGVRHAPVKIGRNVWLANRAIVLRGVSIGDHCVVASGAVVTADLPARSIAAGNPARIVGEVRCQDNFRRGFDPVLA